MLCILLTQTFAAGATRAQTVSAAALCMAAVSLALTVSISIVIRHVGRVKIQLPVAVLMPTVLVILIVVEQCSHGLAFLYAIACTLAFCDSCLHITVAGK